MTGHFDDGRRRSHTFVLGNNGAGWTVDQGGGDVVPRAGAQEVKRVSSLEVAVEAAVRSAYEGWVGPMDARPDPPPRLQLVPNDGSLPGPKRRRMVVTWADILGAAEAAADIGAQVRAELARIGRVPSTSTGHR